jgi:hypothetical protein
MLLASRLMTCFPINILWVHLKGIVSRLMLQQNYSFIDAINFPYPFLLIYSSTSSLSLSFAPGIIASTFISPAIQIEDLLPFKVN